MEYDFNKRQFGKDVRFHKYFLKIKGNILLSKLKKLRGNIKKLNLLDIGCNNGEFEELIAHEFNKIVGIDVVRSQIKKAKFRNIPNCEFLIMNGKNLKFNEKKFDVIIIINILHHVSESNHFQLLKESYRVLKPKGILIIFEHNPHNPLVFLRFRYISKIDKGCDMIYPRNLKNKCDLAKFKNIKIEYVLSELWGEYCLLCKK